MPTGLIHEELALTRYKKGIERDLETYFEENGFTLIEPRTFQNYDDYLLSNFRQDSSKTVKVVGGDSRIFVLRPDITTNILTDIFSKWDGNEPLQVYYNSKIYRNGSKGQIQEHYQMGIESLGHKPLAADLKMIEMAGTILQTLGKPYILEVGSSTLLDLLFKGLDLKLVDENEIRNLINSKNRKALSAKLESLQIQDPLAHSLLSLEGDMGDVLEKARTFKMSEELSKALASLEGLQKSLIKTNLLKNIKLDLSMVPDLDYYDGIIFKGYCLGVPKKIVSGGRYDRLTERFGRKVSAIGFALNMDLVTSIRIEGEKM